MYKRHWMREQTQTGSSIEWYGKYLWPIKHPRLIVTEWYAYTYYIHVCTPVLFMPDTQKTHMHAACMHTHIIYMHTCTHTHTHTHTLTPPYSHTHPLPSFSLLAPVFVDRRPSKCKIPNYNHYLSSTDTTNPFARGLPTWPHGNCKASS